jgi:hypothetical protein
MINGILLGSAVSLCLGQMAVAVLFLAVTPASAQAPVNVSELFHNSLIFLALVPFAAISFFGHLKSRRWRWQAQAAVAVAIAGVAFHFLAG